jgi:hypothetical protein
MPKMGIAVRLSARSLTGVDLISIATADDEAVGGVVRGLLNG